MIIEIGQDSDGGWYAKICEDGESPGTHCRRFRCAGLNAYKDGGFWYVTIDYVTGDKNASILGYGETLGFALENMVTQLERSGMVLDDEPSQRILG
jgi:hypothetical protein